MSFNINEFLSEINAANGLQRNNAFNLTIPVPPILLGTQISDTNAASSARLLSFTGCAANIPGVTLGASDVRRYGVGVSEKKPYVAAFTDAVFQFYVDGQGGVLNFFHSWIGSIFNFDPDKTVAYNDTFESAYKDDYATDMNVTLFTPQGKNAGSPMEITLINAFPLSITETPLSWNDVNSVMMITVVMSFHTWQTKSTVNRSSTSSNTQSNPASVSRFSSDPNAATVYNNATTTYKRF